MRRVRALVSGRVQGVGFRYSTRNLAERLGLCGHARNLADGRVEVVIEGDDASVEEALAFLRRGPPGAAVTGVDERPERPAGLQAGFRVA